MAIVSFREDERPPLTEEHIERGTVWYRGYTAPFEWMQDDGIYYGKVEDSAGIVCYEGETVEQLCRTMMEAVDWHLEICEKRGMAPHRQVQAGTEELVSV